MVTTTADRLPVADAVRTPSVLAVLVASDGLPWLRECLRSLAGQSHPRLGVVAVDNGSTDGSREVLEQALGPERVLTLSENPGLAGALRAALELPVARAADYVLVLHDDAALAPDAVERMVDAAQGIRGVERVGVVGPKVVDWDDPRILREVGRSTDRFGHPHTPLQDGEIDQGQYDRILEVLYVSSCAMLVSREAWQRTGLLDERYGGRHDDLDFCWRARLAGFRVLMTPVAQARHRAAGARGERSGAQRRSSQYFAERAALASMLKNYGLVSLLWLLPLHFVIGIPRMAYLSLSRRFEDAYDLLASWAWNLVHLPSTLSRRVRAQSVRSVGDRLVRRFMESTFVRMPRWFREAERILEEQVEEEREAVPARARVASLASQHPVLVAWALGIGVAALAFRTLVGPEPLQGGVLAAFPPGPSDFFRELLSGVRSTALGGTGSASPALGALGALSGASFASTGLAQKLLLVLLPPAGGVVLYRSVLRQTGQRVGAVVASAAYVFSAVILWAFSEGRIDVLVAAAVLPPTADRLDAAFGRDRPGSPWRFVVGLGAVTAVGVAFLPGILPALAVVMLVQLVAGRRRGRGLLLALASAAAAAVLVFPILPDIATSPGAALSSVVGTTRFASLARVAPGTGVGAGPVAWFLPAAALVAFSVVGKEYRARAWRAVAAAVAGVFLAWASAAGYLPVALANAPAYLVLAALSEAFVVGYGLAAIGSGMERQAFGYRQVAAGVMGLVLAVGLGGQAFSAVVGDWDIGPNALPSAWPVIAGVPGEFRVLWLGRLGGGRFPAPGGDPVDVVDAGAASVRFAITDRDGVSALDTGRGDHGAGYAYLRRVLGELLSGRTSHGGALLAPLGVRFIVADEGSRPGVPDDLVSHVDLPRAARDRLDAQLDLDMIPAGGLLIYRNARAWPPAFVTASEALAGAAATEDLGTIASVPRVEVTPIPAAPGGFAGTAPAGYGFVSEQDEGGWRVQTGGRSLGTEPAFGWGIGFEAAEGTVRLTYADQWIRTTEMTVLLMLWLAVLWITRRPGSR